MQVEGKCLTSIKIVVVRLEQSLDRTEKKEYYHLQITNAMTRRST